MPWFVNIAKIEHWTSVCVSFFWRTFLLGVFLAIYQARVATVIQGNIVVAENVFSNEAHLIKGVVVLVCYRLWGLNIFLLDPLWSQCSSQKLMNSIIDHDDILLHGTILFNNLVLKLVDLLPVIFIQTLWADMPSNFLAFCILEVLDYFAPKTVFEWLISKNFYEFFIDFDGRFSLTFDVFKIRGKISATIVLLVQHLYFLTWRNLRSQLLKNEWILFFFLFFFLRLLQNILILQTVPTRKITNLNSIIDIGNILPHSFKLLLDFFEILSHFLLFLRLLILLVLVIFGVAPVYNFPTAVLTARGVVIRFTDAAARLFFLTVIEGAWGTISLLGSKGLVLDAVSLEHRV